MKHVTIMMMAGLVFCLAEFMQGGVILNMDNPYLVVNLETWTYRYTNEAPDVSDDTCRTTELWLRHIPAGTFMMGSPEDELGRSDDEQQHQVTISKDYYIGVFECTKKQWELVMGTDDSGVAKPRDQYIPGEMEALPEYPEGVNGDTHPRNNISYYEIRGNGWPKSGRAPARYSFMGKLMSRTGLLFDLPTEAEWEYACRAGTTSAFNTGKNMTSDKGQDDAFDEAGRNFHNREDGKGDFNSFTTVGQYLPNAWGLYDMHGNVAEFCLDWLSLGYDTEEQVDPCGAQAGDYRVTRGGYWWTILAGNARSAYRDGYSSTLPSYDAIGFRVGCFSTEAPQSEIEIKLQPGWNLVAMPHGADTAKNLSWLQELTPFMHEASENTYAQAWVPLQTACPLWIYSREASSFKVACHTAAEESVTLQNGWQLVGMSGEEDTVLKDSSIRAVWSWNGRGFEPVAALADGSYRLAAAGYWVYVENQ